MISGIVRFVLFRVFGARVLLVLAVVGWIRRRLWPRSADNIQARRQVGRRPSRYEPS